MSVRGTQSGPHTMSDLSPECAPKRTSADHSEFMSSRLEPSLSSNLNSGQFRCPICAFAQSILVPSLLNLCEVPVTHAKGFGEKVLMTKLFLVPDCEF